MKKTALLVLLGGLVGGSSLFADTTLYFDSVSGTYNGVNYNAASYGGPYYISPYFGHTTGNAVGSLILFCIDFDHYINVPDSTPAVTRTLSTDGTFGGDTHYQYAGVTAGSGASSFINGALPSGTNISAMTAYERYEAAIYLLNTELVNGYVQDARKRALYQYALWEMFLQNGPPDGNAVYSAALNTINGSDANFKADVDALVLGAYNFVHVNGAANQAYLTNLLPYYTVVDATSNPGPIGGKYQEFLTPNSLPPDLPRVPEPASIVLLGSVLTAVSLTLRRRIS